MAVVKVVNNGFGSYKSSETSVKPSWGVERIPFNGLVEASPTAGPASYALNTGDPRFLFTNGIGQWFYALNDSNAGSGNFNASINTIGTFIGTTGVTNQTVTGTLTINFYGTDLNLLIADGLVGGAGNSWSIAPVVNGTAGTTITQASGQFSPVISTGTSRSNQVLPLNLNLIAGNHTVVLTISLNPGASQPVGAILPLYGCEIINEKTNTTGDIDISNGDIYSDGYRYKLENGDANNSLPPIIPSSYTGSAGARILTYINSLDSTFGQAITDVVEEIVEVGGQGTTYQVQLSTPGTTGTLTIPAGAGTIRVITFGGGTGGSSSGTGRINGFGGGGGARAEVIYTRNSGNTSTLALTSTIGAAGESTTASLAATLVATAGGAGNSNGGSGGNAGAGGTANVPSADPGITGWTRTSIVEINGNTGGGGGGGAGGAAGGVGGNTGVSVGITTGNIPLFPLTTVSEIAGRTEGSGGGQTSTGDPVSTTTGAIPGGGGSGETAGGPVPGAGARGETYIIYTLATAATPVTNGTHTSADAFEVGTPQERFSFATHAGQEVIRKINFREFGANNQFALSGSASDRAFTLDDGTTTLVGNNTTNAAGDILSNNSDGQFFTLTFVGTGLDVLRKDAAAGTNDAQIGVTVDGFSIGNVPDGQTGSTQPRIVPIVSGLSYGTHTVRIAAVGSVNAFSAGFQDFIIYGPEKPTIPSSSVEITDYNIMADFAGTDGSTTAATNRLRIGKGTLRKMSTREFIYTNEAISGPDIDTAAISGFQINMENGNVPFFYTFYGTGCELRFSTRTDKVLQFFIDQPTGSGNTATPLTLTSANFLSGDSTTYTIQNGTAGSFNGATVPATNNAQVFLDNTVDANSGFRVTGLTLGVHTIAVMGRTSSMAFRPRCLDIITPTHFQEDTLKLGNTSIGDVRPDYANIATENEVVSNLGEAKAWAKSTQSSGAISASYNLAAVLTTSTTTRFFWDKPFKDANYVAIPTGSDAAAFLAENFFPGSVSVRRRDSGATSGPVSVVAYGELIDE